MPVQILRDASAQMEQLSTATKAKVKAAMDHHLNVVMSGYFGLEPRTLSPAELKEMSLAARGMEVVGTDLISRSEDPQLRRDAWERLLLPAYRLRRAMARPGADLSLIIDVVVDGVLANRQPELRLALEAMQLSGTPDANAMPWDELLHQELFRTFLLLVRKSGGYSDINAALEAVSRLRELQASLEPQFLAEDDLDRALVKANIVVAYYNLAKVLEITGQFLKGDFNVEAGTTGITPQGVKDELERFTDSAREVLLGVDPAFRQRATRIRDACKALIDSSVYAAVLPPKTKELMVSLARQKSRPVTELWYSQRAALSQSLLDPTKAAVVVSMPTSAGKTLLAEMAILEAHHDAPESHVIYLAPTRALVTQVCLTLRRDLGRELKVRVATPTFELDPVEAEVLASEYDVLVTTPEKLDLLVRLGHPSVEAISLVVVDEAHNINVPDRGARLELLLATLRRERPGTRFLMLTPFAKNAGQLARWLGGDNGAPIIVDWKPNDRVVGTMYPGRKSGDERPLEFRTLDSAHGDYDGGQTIRVGTSPSDIKDSKEKLSLESVLKWAEAKDGGILLLASTRRNAEQRANTLAGCLPEADQVPTSVDMVCRYLDAEADGNHPLSPLLRRGVAFHHSGLSSEARYFIERLVEDGSVRILCATTTLAQGVHFPLSVAVIESIYRPERVQGSWVNNPLEPWEFWNIAGRVGRTLEDPVGVIAFSSVTAKQVSTVRGYVTKDASYVESALYGFLKGMSAIENISFSTTFLSRHKAASAFLQYIVHAMAVSGRVEVKNELESLIRASFVFQQARAEDPSMADLLIRLARQYVLQLETRKGQSLDGFAKLADGTGFSSPSVDFLIWYQSQQGRPRVEEWAAEAIFPPDGSASELLTGVVDALRRVPEVRLGTEDDGEFNPERVARITAGWVNGRSLKDLADAEYGGDILKCAHHIYSTVVSAMPWGLRAVQRVAFAGREDIQWEHLDLLPAMVFHGVKSREAVALRMLSVPRMLAERMAEKVRTSGVRLQDVSEWLANDQWQDVVPAGSRLAGGEYKVLWEVLEGRKTWADAFQ